MFFGTPHFGPADHWKIKIGKTCVKIAQSLPGSVSNDVMQALEKGSLFSDSLQSHGRHQLECYQFVTFYEGIGNVKALT